jgi:transposase
MTQNLSHQSEMHGLGEFHFIRLTAEFISKRRDTPELVVFLKISAASSPGRKLLFVCRTIAAAWSPITSTRKVAISQLAFLPSYPPQLNPVEYLWGHWKPHEMLNLCPRDFVEQTSRRRLLEAGLNGGQNHQGAESAFLDASSRPAVQSSRQILPASKLLQKWWRPAALRPQRHTIAKPTTPQ